MSESTQDQTPETSPAMANKIAFDKKKLKVLKNALKMERAERISIEKELEAAQKNIDSFKHQLNDKVRFESFKSLL